MDDPSRPALRVWCKISQISLVSAAGQIKSADQRSQQRNKTNQLRIATGKQEHPEMRGTNDIPNTHTGSDFAADFREGKYFVISCSGKCRYIFDDMQDFQAGRNPPATITPNGGKGQSLLFACLEYRSAMPSGWWVPCSLPPGAAKRNHH